MNVCVCYRAYVIMQPSKGIQERAVFKKLQRAVEQQMLIPKVHDGPWTISEVRLREQIGPGTYSWLRLLDGLEKLTTNAHEDNSPISTISTTSDK